MNISAIPLAMPYFNTVVHLRVRVGASRTFMPAALLNAILFANLWLADHFIPPSIRSVDVLYVLLMAAAGGLVYALCFLYLPLPTLAAETARWKTRRKLAKATV